MEVENLSSSTQTSPIFDQFDQLDNKNPLTKYNDRTTVEFPATTVEDDDKSPVMEMEVILYEEFLEEMEKNSIKESSTISVTLEPELLINESSCEEFENLQSSHLTNTVDEDEESQDNDEKINNIGCRSLFLKEIKEIKNHHHDPKIRVQKISIPKNLDRADVSFILERSSSSNLEPFEGFRYAHKPTTVDLHVVTSLIRRRNAAFNDFLDARNNKKK